MRFISCQLKIDALFQERLGVPKMLSIAMIAANLQGGCGKLLAMPPELRLDRCEAPNDVKVGLWAVEKEGTKKTRKNRREEPSHPLVVPPGRRPGFFGALGVTVPWVDSPEAQGGLWAPPSCLVMPSSLVCVSNCLFVGLQGDC